jgi:thiol-disulfide isomerase/thioredoxin
MRCQRLRHVSLVFLLLGCVALPALASADDNWLHEYDEAVTAAKQQGKDILIDFSGTDWCGNCQQLWNQILSQPEFIELASRRFVLLDIDNLARKPMPEGRKERYEALQKRYGIQAFPTVVLATADGLPYAATGQVPELKSPSKYWQHLEPLFERGQKFKTALAAEGGPQDLDSASSIVGGLAEVRPDFVVRFYSGKLDQLRKLKPPDETGYLAFIDSRSALLALEWKLHEGFAATCDKWSDGEAIKGRWVPAFAPRDVDTIIEKRRLRGASLQEALLARAFLEIDDGQWPAALATLEALGNVDGTLSRFEQSNFVQISIRSADEFRQHVRAARQLSDDPLAQLRALYKILRSDLECVTPTACCNHSFTVQMHYLVAGAAYGELLLKSTAGLQGKDRAKAIGKGLEDIDLYANGSIGRLVCDFMPELVGKEAAMEYLPPRYANWLKD